MGSTESERSAAERAAGRLMSGLRRRWPSLDARLERWFQALGFGALPSPPAYFEDGLCSIHDHGFVADERFERAYRRGVQASGGVDHRIRWRAHVFLWAARQAASLPGDLVECGVNTGFLSSALLTDLDWNRRDKTLYLLDTFAGPVEAQYSADELAQGRWELARRAVAEGAYQTSLEAVRANFAEWERVRLVPGTVPETLPQVDAERLAFVHLDMNCAAPEIAALEYFWPRLVPGGRGFGGLRRAGVRRAAPGLQRGAGALGRGDGRAADRARAGDQAGRQELTARELARRRSAVLSAGRLSGAAGDIAHSLGKSASARRTLGLMALGLCRRSGPGGMRMPSPAS